MATKTAGQLVRLSELAGRTLGSVQGVQELLDEIGAEVVSAWDGAPAVSEDDAREAVDLYEERRSQTLADQRAYTSMRSPGGSDVPRPDGKRSATRSAPLMPKPSKA